MRNKFNKGFALIEVIVSMVILSIVLASAVSLLFSLSLAIEKNRDRLVATYLAQECLELVRNSRDTAWRNHHQWDCAWNDEVHCSEENILSGLNRKKIVVHGKETKFSREFVVSEIENANPAPILKQETKEILITCRILWEGGKLSISEILTNWRKI
jgi:prepilin-type N-terminal cleavage/methylation domain-containing protein